MTSRSHKFIIWLLAIWGLLFITTAAWSAPGREKAPAGLIPAELRGVDIKDYYNGSGARDAGVIQITSGHVIVARDGMKQAYFAVRGDRLFEKDTIFTLKGSRCRFQLNGQDVATMGESTRLGIKTAVENRKTQTKTSIFSVLRGKVMFYAIRLLKYRNSAMTVETPTAVSGVRGTKWGVEVIETAGTPAASLPVLVADATFMGGFHHLAQSSRSMYRANIYCFEGSVFVNSPITGQTITLNGGQGVAADNRGLGQPAAIPPGVMNQFLNDVGVPGAAPPPTLPDGSTSKTPLPPDTSTIIQQQKTYPSQPPPSQQGYQGPQGR
jgi:hypothetical protein